MRIAIIAGEHSGDRLGGSLIRSLRARLTEPLELCGVGGEAMAAAGLETVFPLDDVAVMGPFEIAKSLPRLVRRVYQAVDHVLACAPDALIIIDSPEFTHPIARRVRRRARQIPIINYVSPTVWGWRPGRAPRMRKYVDHVLALLPFEPDAHARLGGPACTYVGHALTEKIEWINALDVPAFAARLALDRDRETLVVLPGSRGSEIKYILPVFIETLQQMQSAGRRYNLLVPSVERHAGEIGAQMRAAGLDAHILQGEADKFCAFRSARAALAASGTVTLELAVSGTPMVVGYKLDFTAEILRYLISADTVVLANHVLGRHAFPEFLQEQCRPEALSLALGDILVDGPGRVAQLDALGEIPSKMAPPGGLAPSDAAADVVLGVIGLRGPGGSSGTG